MNAATAAYCESAGGQIVKFRESRCSARRSCGGTSIQPIRHPVIEKYFENELITTDSRDVCHADAVATSP